MLKIFEYIYIYERYYFVRLFAILQEVNHNRSIRLILIKSAHLLKKQPFFKNTSVGKMLLAECKRTLQIKLILI